MSDNLERFRALFRGRENFHGQFTSLPGQTPDKKATTEKGPAPTEAWVRHLEGVAPGLGISPHTITNHCYFGVIDVDDNAIDHVALAAQVVEYKLPLIVCRSRSGGAHLYVFFNEPVACALVVSKLEAWARSLGHAENLDGRKIETFPRKAVNKAEDSAPWINLPYFGMSSRVAITPKGQEMTVDDFIHVAESLQVNEAELEVIRAQTGNEFEEDGPPCLQAIFELPGHSVEGARNNHLAALATYFKFKYPDNWTDHLREHNEKYIGKDNTEVGNVLKSYGKTGYTYRCTEQPIVAHCQKVICGRRAYGYKTGIELAALNKMPPIENLRLRLSDPRVWVLTLKGKDISFGSAEILNPTIVKERVFDQLKIMIPDVKRSAWQKLIQDRCADAPEIAVPTMAGVEGAFITHVYEFLTVGSRNANSLEDVQRGNAYAKDGRIYFTHLALRKYLDAAKFKEYNDAQVWQQLERMGAKASQESVSGLTVELYSLADDITRQTDPYAIPATARSEF